MGDPLSTSTAASRLNIPPPPPPPPVTLVQPSSSKKKLHKPKVIRAVRNVFRSLPIITPVYKIPALPGAHARLPDGKSCGGGRVTGTLFGYRKGLVSLAVQANPKTVPMLVVELGMQTQALQKELSQGMLRITLECDKQKKTNLMDEPLWTMYANGQKNGYGVRREATEDDLHVMEVLKATSMGAGVLPPRTGTETEGGDGEMSYMRWQFDRVVGSKDIETLYMLSPEGGGDNEPDLSIFFVRS